MAAVLLHKIHAGLALSAEEMRVLAEAGALPEGTEGVVHRVGRAATLVASFCGAPRARRLRTSPRSPPGAER